jgi:hypothetical protein
MKVMQKSVEDRGNKQTGDNRENRHSNHQRSGQEPMAMPA